jgi:predicted ester cyclase
MHEPAMTFDDVSLPPQKEVVRVFFKELWDRPDKTLIRNCSIPTSRSGARSGRHCAAEFAGYVDMVTGALGHCTSDIIDMLEEGSKVFAKLRYHGYHRGEFLGFAPTGRHVWWYGTPFFTFDGDKVRDLWVLGDVYGLMAQLH